MTFALVVFVGVDRTINGTSEHERICFGREMAEALERLAFGLRAQPGVI